MPVNMMPQLHPLERWRLTQDPPITQTELAKRLGITQAAVAKWESGSRWPATRFLRRLHRITGIELIKLVP